MNRIGHALRARRRQFREARLERRALRIRDRSRALFVGITGSSAKTTTAALLRHILSTRGVVAAQLAGNLRNSLLTALDRMPANTDFVVHEIAATKIGQLKSYCETLRPHVAIVTMIELEHKSAFGKIEAVAAEKGELAAALRCGGLAVLNADDPLVMGMVDRTPERVVTFGRSENADYRACDVRAHFPAGLSLQVVWKEASLSLVSKFVGEHFWLPVLAAVATAIELHVPLSAIADRVASFEPLFTRCGMLSIPNGPTFIVDTTKAPWYSIPLAFEIVRSTEAEHKRIVLGHMSDFASSTTKYRDAYRMARAIADQVIFVGNHRHRSKASEADQNEGRFLAFETAEQVSNHIRRTAFPGELILLKGSADLHLERVALSWIHEVKCWKGACGKVQNCLDCGLYTLPYDLHRGKKRRNPGLRIWKRLGLSGLRANRV